MPQPMNIFVIIIKFQSKNLTKQEKIKQIAYLMIFMNRYQKFMNQIKFHHIYNKLI